MWITKWQNSLKEEISAVEKLGVSHFVNYFEDLLKGYQELNKKSVDTIISEWNSPESLQSAYEYVYNFWALLNMYQKLHKELLSLSQEAELKEIMLWKRDSKIDWITESYTKNLNSIIRELEKKNLELEAENKWLSDKNSKLEDELERSNELYLSLEMENRVLDSDNEKMYKENRKLRIDIENLGVILWLWPVNIKTITEFIKKQKEAPKDLWPEILWKAMWIISEDKSYLAEQVKLEKDKNKKHISEKRGLERKLEESQKREEELLRRQREMEEKIRAMTDLIEKENIENTRDWYSPESVSITA